MYLISNDVISIASTSRYHFGLESEFCRMIAIMHCNLGSINLHQNKYNLALISVNKALEIGISCLQSHRIRAEYYIKYRHDINKEFEPNQSKRQPKMHHFGTHKNIKNPKERVFSLNTTNSNGVKLETVVTFTDKDKEKEKENNNSKVYILDGWFTNFFKHENDKKIKESAAKGIISDENISSDDDIVVNGNDTYSFSISSENTNSESISGYDIEDEEESIEHYEINPLPAIEMLDFKHNRRIRPETTSTSPKNMTINHRSIVVAKKIFILPSNYSDPYVYNNIEEVSCGYVLFTDTLHWESFEIHKSEQIIPVLYDKEGKIMFLSILDNKYDIHCLLFEFDDVNDNDMSMLRSYLII